MRTQQGSLWTGKIFQNGFKKNYENAEASFVFQNLNLNYVNLKFWIVKCKYSVVVECSFRNSNLKYVEIIYLKNRWTD